MIAAISGNHTILGHIKFIQGMPYVPDIRDYKPFYIQTDSDEAALDTAAAFGMVAKSNPYPLLPEPKDVFGNDWKDEDGDDEYTAVMRYKAFEFDVSFYVKAYSSGSLSAEAVLRSQVDAFFAKVRGGSFRTYDSYTGVGYRGVRYAGYGEESFLRRGDWARAIFTVTFKANDPVSRVALSGGELTDV